MHGKAEPKSTVMPFTSIYWARKGSPATFIWAYKVPWDDFKQNFKDFKAYIESKNLFRRFQICFSQNPAVQQLSSSAKLAQFRPYRLYCLAGGFLAFTARILKKLIWKLWIILFNPVLQFCLKWSQDTVYTLVEN